MAQRDMPLYNDVSEPSRRVINTDPPKEKLPVSAKLNFSDSKEGPSNRKRRSSIGATETETPLKRLRAESSHSASATPSPWEANRIKIDLIAAKITALEELLHTIRNETEILFKKEKRTLMDRHKRERAISDMENRLQHIRQREQDLKEDFTQAVKEHKESKDQWEKEKKELQKQITDLKSGLLEASVSSEDQLSELTKNIDELIQELTKVMSERAKAIEEVNDLQKELRDQKRFIRKLQKQLSFVQWDRGVIKKHLEVNQTLRSESEAGSAQLAARVDQLQDTLHGCRELIAAYEHQRS